MLIGVDSCWTHVDSCQTRVDWCWLVLICVDSCWTRVDMCWLVLDSCWFVSDSCRFMLTCVDSCWLVLTRVETCWYSCIRIDLIGGLLLKKLKYFEFMLNIFEFWRVWENVESWSVYANKFFWIAQLYFWTNIIKES